MHFHEIFVFQTKKNTLYVTKIWWNCTNILPFMFQIELYGYNGNLPIYLDKFEEESFIVFSDLTPLSLRRNQLVPFEGDGHVSFLSSKFWFQFINQMYGRKEINIKNWLVFGSDLWYFRGNCFCPPASWIAICNRNLPRN